MEIGVVGIIVFVFALALYFLPSWAAYSRNHKSADAVLLLNFLFGWTLLGWIAALIWAFSGPVMSETSETGSEEQPPDGVKSCPFCAETIKEAAKVCRYCGRELPAASVQPVVPALKDDWAG